MPETKNGFTYSIGDIAGHVSPLGAKWIVEALELCSFDPQRLGAGYATWFSYDYGRYGGTLSHRLTFREVPKEQIPNFGQDFCTVQMSPSFATYFILIWDGLATAPPPFGGHRFYMETVLHGLGHVVGELLGWAKDATKRFNVARHLCTDVLARMGYPPGKYGLGATWKFFEESMVLGELSWQDKPTERFAEAFKDIFGHPTARRFINRCGAKLTKGAAERIYSESMNYLPVNWLNFTPHPGVYSNTGITMETYFIEPQHYQTYCWTNDRTCYDYCTQVYADSDAPIPVVCWPCDPSVSYGDVLAGTGSECGNVISFPCYPTTNFRLGVETAIPKLPFCRHVTLTASPYVSWRTDESPWTYNCQGPPKKGYATDNLTVQVRGTAFSGMGIYGDAIWNHETGAFPDKNDQTVKYHSPGSSALNLSLDVDIDDPTKRSNVSWIVNGNIDDFAPKFFDDMTEYATEDLQSIGYRYYAPYVRFLAPSDGAFVDPYSDLKVESVDAGTALAAAAAGRSGVIPDIDYRPGEVPSVMWPSNLTVEGG